MSEQTVVINPENKKGAFKQLLRLIKWGLGAYGSVQVAVSQVRRTKDQNKKQWALLRDISRKVNWFGKTYTPTQWKHILSGSFEEVEFVPNTEGTGLVAVGQETSMYSKKKFSEYIEFIYAFGTTQGVKWSLEAKEAYETHKTTRS